MNERGNKREGEKKREREREREREMGGLKRERYLSLFRKYSQFSFQLLFPVLHLYLFIERRKKEGDKQKEKERERAI